ncbi:MAG: FHA domain-containing protein [Deltaproteobacteria bacterium]|nr:FHA domain-containing protein [Deltaproteobacteria bacterium]
MSDTEITISLTIDLPDGNTRVMEFEADEPIMVGSGASAAVRIEHEDVSSLHCMIKPDEEGGLVVLDLGSDEGTEINGREISGETSLEDGDTVKVGAAQIVVHFGGDMLAPTMASQAMKGHGGKDSEATVKEETPKKAKKADKKTDKKEAKADKKEAKANKSEDKPKKKEAKSDDKPEKSEAKPPKKKAEASTAPTAHHGHHKTALVRTSEHSIDLKEDEKATKKGHIEVSLRWGGSIMGVERLGKNGSVTIGEASAAAKKDAAGKIPILGGVVGILSTEVGLLPHHFQVSDAAIPSSVYHLVTLENGTAKVNIANGMEATVEGAAASGPVLNLDLGQKAVVKIGAIEFVIQYVIRNKVIDLGLMQTVDFFYSKVLAIVLILQAMFIVAMVITPHFNDGADDDLMETANDILISLQKKEKKKEKKQDLSGKKGAKAKKDEGLFGKKDKPKQDKAASKKGAPNVDKDKREEDRKKVSDALAALGLKGPAGAVSNVFGPGGLGAGINNALGGLKGAAMGDAGGAGGLGSRGTGAGGGGSGLGIGGIGSGSGMGTGGRGGLNLGGRGKGMTRIRPGKVTYKGSLSREEIQRVVKRFLSKITFCYNKELAKNPNLSGKLVGTWTIGSAGTVTMAKISQNTMGNKSVGACVVKNIKRMRFPRPKGGGSVFVNYPFVFDAK